MPSEIRVGVGLSDDPDPTRAASQAAEAALSAGGLAAAEGALAFATVDWGGRIRELLGPLREALGTRSIVGASAHGVVAGGLEVEGRCAVSVVAFAGIETVPFWVPELRDFEDCVGSEILARAGGEVSDRDLVVLLPDPSCFAPGRLLGALRESVGNARVVGAGAAPLAGARAAAGRSRGGSAWQWCGSESTQGGLSGLVLRGRTAPQVSITQSCLPVTGLLTVTRTRGHWILELDGRPALDVYREVARGPLAADLRRAAAVLLVALPAGDELALRAGRYRVCNVAGFAEEPRALAVAQAVKPGAQIALALRDPSGARDDLKRMLDGVDPRAASAALYFSCCARGRSFFEVPGLEAAYLERGLGPLPLGGMFGACEIGPLGEETHLLTYTGVLALLGA